MDTGIMTTRIIRVSAQHVRVSAQHVTLIRSRSSQIPSYLTSYPWIE